MVRILAVLIGLLWLVQPAAGAIEEHLRQAIMVIGLRNSQSNRLVRVGTAFYVGNGLFYTNAHVVHAGLDFRKEVSGFDQWILVAPDEFGNPASILGTAEVQCIHGGFKHTPFGDVGPFDVAAVRFTGDSQDRLPKPLSFAQARVAVGERVRAIGFPEASVMFEMRGSVVEVNPERITVRRDIGTTTLPGSSGSPLFNGRNEVVGVHQGSNVGALMTLAVPIQSALAGCPAGGSR